MKIFYVNIFTINTTDIYSKYMVYTVCIDMNENIVTRKFPTQILQTNLMRITI